MDYLDFLQYINNLVYSYIGLTDFTLELQIYINSKRFELDICDKSEVLIKNDEGEFTQ